MVQINREGSWIRARHQYSARRVRLFCIPYAGGGASLFREWAGRLPDFIEVRPVYLPGRERRLHEPAFTRLSALLTEFTPELLHYTGEPFAFYGHSMGALIAFELSRALRNASGIEPLHLFVSASPAPHIAERRQAIHQLPGNRFVEALRRLNGTPSEILENDEFIQLLMPTLRADFELCETYAYKSDRSLNCPISVFGGKEDSVIEHKKLQVWQNHTTAMFTLRMLQDGHFLRNSEQVLLDAIAADLHMSLHASRQSIAK